MKFSVFVLVLLVGVACAQFNRNPYNFNRNRNAYYAPTTTERPYYRPYYRPDYYARTGQEKLARTLKENFDLADNGNYQYNFETDNGIRQDQSGYTRNLGGSPPVLAQTVQGSYSWTSPEGIPVSISYIADENGYRAVGDAIPTPPPIPDYILRSIEFNKAEEAKRARLRF